MSCPPVAPCTHRIPAERFDYGSVCGLGLRLVSSGHPRAAVRGYPGFFVPTIDETDTLTLGPSIMTGHYVRVPFLPCTMKVHYSFYSLTIDHSQQCGTNQNNMWCDRDCRITARRWHLLRAAWIVPRPIQVSLSRMGSFMCNNKYQSVGTIIFAREIHVNLFCPFWEAPQRN